MEAQEFGEMMEHIDEVNFALDGLRKTQPVWIKRASLLSLLSICATVQQRRLLRTQRYVHFKVSCNGFSLIFQFWICVIGFQFFFFFLRFGVWKCGCDFLNLNVGFCWFWILGLESLLGFWIWSLGCVRFWVILDGVWVYHESCNGFWIKMWIFDIIYIVGVWNFHVRFW